MLKKSGILILAILGVIAASLLPDEDKAALHTQGVLHPWMHLVAFGLVAFLAMASTRSPRGRLILLIGVLVVGWGTEYAEHLMHSSPFEAMDFFADTAGVALGSMLSLFTRGEVRY